MSPDIHIVAERSQVHRDSSSRGVVSFVVMKSNGSAQQRNVSSELRILTPN
jgi:hypothetical protein